MKLELSLPDATSPDTVEAIRELFLVLSQTPDAIFEVGAWNERAFFNDSRLAQIEEARESVRRGELHTLEEVRKYFAEKSASWQSQE
jgi:alkylhydroperoxidase family enzyme